MPEWNEYAAKYCTKKAKSLAYEADHEGYKKNGPMYVHCKEKEQLYIDLAMEFRELKIAKSVECG
jgi:hypothetical protein